MSAPAMAPVPPSPAVIAPNVIRVIAPNPSPMTYWGTNTYIIGQSDVAIIDPGPADPAHIDAVLAALPAGAHVRHILVSHAHLDHSPGAALLKARTDAPVLAFGTAEAGRSLVMQALAREGLAGGGEGVDVDFSPDHTLSDGDAVHGDDYALTAWHTPGHMGNHLSFALGDALFCGDLVMGWSSSLVSPPDGDLTDFMASCRRLAAQNWHLFLPGHGDPIPNPAARLDWLIEHRMTREAQVLAAIAQTPATATDLAARIYTDVAPHLLPAAARNVFAHLVDLTGRNLVRPQGSLSATSVFEKI